MKLRNRFQSAKAEVDRLKENRKLMEEKKSSLRKLKKDFVKGKKLEEARLINP